MAIQPHQARHAGSIGTAKDLLDFEVTMAGTVEFIRVKSDKVPSGTVNFKLYKNDVDTGLSFSMVGPSNTITKDLVALGQTFSVARGDRIRFATHGVISPFSSVGQSLFFTMYIEDGLPTQYGGTSTSSVTVGTGTKNFTQVELNPLGYQVGTRMRAAYKDDPTIWMEGVVTDYDGETFEVLVDNSNGAGTYDDWNFNLAGEKGSQGPVGPQGEPGISVFAIQTVNHVTASMDHESAVAEAVELGKSYIVTRVETDKECRIRLFRSPEQRTADAGRVVGVDPTGEHGVVLDIVLTTGNLVYDLSPIPFGSSGETPRSSDVPILVQNLSGATGTVDINFTIIKLEV